MAEGRARRAAPRDAAAAEDLPPEAAETLATFRTIARLREDVDREAFGALILSMTRSAADILGVYLLAKEAGLVRRRRGGRALHAAHRAAARDDPGSAPRARHHEANCSRCRWCSAASMCRARSRRS